MAVQQVYILVSPKYIQAGYFRDNQIVAISIDGNLKISYSSDNDFERLIESIKDTFNVDELNDVELSITIVSCGAITSVTDHLFEIIKTSKNHYIINAETVIPFICACKGLLSDKKTTKISILDSLYQISEREEGRVFCCQLNNDASEMEVHTLELSDLSSIVNFDITKLGMDESVVAQFNKTIDELKKEIAKLNSENDKHSKTEKKLNEDFLSYKKRYEQAVFQYQSLLVSSRKLVRFDKTLMTINKPVEGSSFSKNEIYLKLCHHFSGKEQSNEEDFSHSYSLSSNGTLGRLLFPAISGFEDNIIFKDVFFLKNNLQIVSEGEDLIRFEYKMNHLARSNDGVCILKSPFAGKLFFRENVENYFDDNCIIGCICHPDDDENLVKLWLETQPRA